MSYTPVNKAGDTMTGALYLPSGGLNVGNGQLVVDSGGRVLMPNQPAFFVYSTTTFSGTNSVIPLPYALLNNGSCFNLATYRFTAPVGGLYSFQFHIRLSSSNSGNQDFSFGINKNGSNAQGVANDPAYYPSGIWGSGSQGAVLQLSIGDYIDVRTYGVIGGVDMRWFSGHLIG
jgi:hypothetical protein